jgi:cysteine synthase A
LFTAGDIVHRFQNLDYVFVPVSSAGTITGVSQRLKKAFPHIQIVAVDAEGSAIFGTPSRKRYIPGLGASIVPPMLEFARIDHVIHVNEADTIRACRSLYNRHGIMGGGSAGAAYAAIQRFFANHTSLRRPNVLFLCADHGQSYADSVYDDRWAQRFTGSL